MKPICSNDHDEWWGEATRAMAGDGGREISAQPLGPGNRLVVISRALRIGRLIVTVAAGLSVGMTGSWCDAAEAARLHAGTARVEITPPVGQSMGGYTSRLQANSGACQDIHDPLFARVLVLRQGDLSLAIVSLDLLFFSSRRVIAEAQRQWGISHVILASSHTHAGPIPHTGGLTNWSNLNVNPTNVLNFEAFSQDPWYAATEDKVIAAIGEAMTNVFAARLAAGRGTLNSYYMAHNRRYVNTNGTVTMWWTNPSRLPTAPLDPTVGVIRIDDDSGQRRALLVNYACHPVILSDQNLSISAEFPGAMAERIGEALGADCLPMFLQGAAGDLDPHDSTSGTNGFYRVRQAGRDLGDEALRVADTLMPVENASLRVYPRIMVVPERTAGRYAAVRSLTVMLNTDTALAAVPGEPFVRHQLDLRERSPFPNAFLLGLAYSGGTTPFTIYLPTVQAAREGGYGASEATFLAAQGGEWILDGIVRAMHELSGTSVWGRVYHVVPTGTPITPVAPYASWDTAANGIEEVLALAQDGDTVLVSNGLYRITTQISVTNAIVLRSYNRGALDRDGTLIDGDYPNRTGRCLYVNHPDAVVEGFTITNGYVMGDGGGVYLESGLLRGCRVTGNTATNNGRGGGIYATGAGALISYCEILGNATMGATTEHGGGGVMLKAGAQAWNSLIAHNQSPLYYTAGGGVHSDGGMLVNCMIVSNTAVDGYNCGGVYSRGAQTRLRGCLIVGNGRGRASTSMAAGVGLSDAAASVVLENCTIVSNYGRALATSWHGGSFYATNTIIHANAGTWSTATGRIVASYCSVSDIAGLTGGEGNLTNNPRFVNTASGNYRLSISSPCLNSGTNQSWMAEAVDLDGNRRINRGSGRVDRGCYEAVYGDPGMLLMFR